MCRNDGWKSTEMDHHRDKQHAPNNTTKSGRTAAEQRTRNCQLRRGFNLICAGAGVPLTFTFFTAVLDAFFSLSASLPVVGIFTILLINSPVLHHVKTKTM